MKVAIKTELIKDYIKSNNLTIKGFCKKCNISQKTYYRIMNGATHINIRVIYKILIEMQIFCEDLITYK